MKEEEEVRGYKIQNVIAHNFLELLDVMYPLPGSFLAGPELTTIYTPITDDAVFLKSMINCYRDKLSIPWRFTRTWTVPQESFHRCWVTTSDGISLMIRSLIRVYFVPVPVEHTSLDATFYVIALLGVKQFVYPDRPIVFDRGDTYMRVVDCSSAPRLISQAPPPPPPYMPEVSMTNLQANVHAKTRWKILDRFVRKQTVDCNARWLVFPWSMLRSLLYHMPWSFIAGSLPAFIAGVTRNLVDDPTSIFVPLVDDADFLKRMLDLNRDHMAGFCIPREYSPRCWYTQHRSGCLRVYFQRVPFGHMGSKLEAVIYTIGCLDLRINRYWLQEEGIVNRGKHKMHVKVVDCSGDRAAARNQVINLHKKLCKCSDDLADVKNRFGNYLSEVKHADRPAMSLMGICLGKLMEMDAYGERELGHPVKGIAAWRAMGHRSEPLIVVVNK